MGKASRGKRERREERELRRVRRSADLQIERREYTDGTTEVTFPPGLLPDFEAHLAEFEKRFGRPAEPDDPLFYDPDCDVPTPLTEDRIIEMLAGAMTQAGCEPEVIETYRRTGILLTEMNRTLMSARDTLEWHATLADVVGETINDYAPLAGQYQDLFEQYASPDGATGDDAAETGFGYHHPLATYGWVFAMAGHLHANADGIEVNADRIIPLVCWVVGQQLTDDASPLHTPYGYLLLDASVLAGRIGQEDPTLHRTALRCAAQYNASAEYAEFAGLLQNRVPKGGGGQEFIDAVGQWQDQTDVAVQLFVLATVYAAVFTDDEMFDDCITRLVAYLAGS